jgi:hypothetical protein
MRRPDGRVVRCAPTRRGSFVAFVAGWRTRLGATKLARFVVYVAASTRRFSAFFGFCRDKTQVGFVVSVPALAATKRIKLDCAFCAHFSRFAASDFGQQVCEFSKSGAAAVASLEEHWLRQQRPRMERGGVHFNGLRGQFQQLFLAAPFWDRFAVLRQFRRKSHRLCRWTREDQMPFAAVPRQSRGLYIMAIPGPLTRSPAI